jgi:hypothetical protein
LTYILLLLRSRFDNIWHFQIMTFYHNVFQKLAEVNKINSFFIQHRLFYMVWWTCNGDTTISNLDQGTGYSNEIFIWFCHFLHSNLEIVCWLGHDYCLLNQHHSVLHGLSCWLGHKHQKTYHMKFLASCFMFSGWCTAPAQPCCSDSSRRFPLYILILMTLSVSNF